MIKIDIPMPKSCNCCFATYWCEEECLIYCGLTNRDVDKSCTNETRNEDCPLKEVSE